MSVSGSYARLGIKTVARHFRSHFTTPIKIVHQVVVGGTPVDGMGDTVIGGVTTHPAITTYTVGSDVRQLRAAKFEINAMDLKRVANARIPWCFSFGFVRCLGRRPI